MSLRELSSPLGSNTRYNWMNSWTHNVSTCFGSSRGNPHSTDQHCTLITRLAQHTESYSELQKKEPPSEANPTSVPQTLAGSYIQTGVS